MDGLLLSPQQRHIWSHVRAGAAFGASCVVRIDGPLDLRRLRGALARVVHGHDMLRATFTCPAPGAGLVQGMGDHDTVTITVIDTGGVPAHPPVWDRYRADDAGRAPALRATLVRLDADRHVLTLTLPALCADARSLGNVAAAVAAAYRGGNVAPPPPYAQFAAWQAALAEHGTDPRHLRAHDARADRLPFEKAPAGSAAAWAGHSVTLAPGKLAGSDPAAVLACWQVVLWQQTRHTEVATGWVADGRVYQELAPVVGPCATVLPVLARLGEADQFEMVRRQAEQVIDDLTAVPEVIDWQVPGAPAHPKWGFEFTKTHRAGGEEVSFTVEDVCAWTGPFTVKLGCLALPGGGLRMTLEYDTGRVDDGMASCLLDQVVAVAHAASADPQRTVRSLCLVGEAEARRLTVELNRTETAGPGTSAAHELVAAQARQSPNRVAVTANGQATTYSELNAAANQLARYLRQLGTTSEARVGICLDRGISMVIAMVAVHKAGAAYVPVDPALPDERIRSIVAGTRMPIIITCDRLMASLPETAARAVSVDADRKAIDAQRADDLHLQVAPGQLAYVLHTSGSTGRPKGVEVPHSAFANFLRSMARNPGLAAEDVLVAVTTLSFDIAALELYLPLTVGARVTIASRQEAADPHALADLVASAAATVLQATPVTWRMLLAWGWTGSPTLTALVGGEAVPAELAARLRPLVRCLWNMYGPTETTIWSACGELATEDGPVSIGRPIDNTRIYVLDTELRPVPAGVVGELFIGGHGLARGYADRPGLTAESFIPDPFTAEAGARMYRTGDLARYGPAGALYVLGRSDSQVKIRGYRVELGEIESALSRHPRVRAAVARAQREPGGDHRLDAYVIPATPGDPPSVGELRDFLQQVLPGPLVPSHIGVLASFPLTANGKVDRAALPQIEAGAVRAGSEHVPAANAMERDITAIWQEVLGVHDLGTTDNFFDLGGHSMRLIQVTSLLRERLGVDVPPVALLEHPTIAALARYLGGGGTAPDRAREASGVTSGHARLRQRRSRMGDKR
ncbi:MAG TPA: amino acid adenylation domain-containing protein [Streptosporangiaceae bacterium]|nr:amino acid adenylation domain-containing protein [Streptosporangiaceae bacterium]